jgi:uncharacterized protein involved in exopolysaccharide biosynthesis
MLTPPPARPAAEDTDPGLIDFVGIRNDIGFVLRSPLRHRWLAAACLLFVLAAAAASSLVVKDIYQVQASFLAQGSWVMLTLANPGLIRGDEGLTRAVRETIVRRDNLIALCEQTGIVDRQLANRSWLGRLRASFYEKLTGHKETRAEVLEGIVNTMQNKLWVNVGGEGTINIVFEWPDPEIAYRVVEAAVPNFQETRYATDVAVLSDTITLLEGNASKLQHEVDTALNDLERKERARPRTTQRRVITRPTPTHQDDDTAKLESTLAARRRALADLEESRLRRVAELNAQLAQKQTIYAEQHPEILNTKRSIAALMQPSPQGEALRTEVKELERELAKRGSLVASDTGDGAADFTTDFIAPRGGVEPEDFRIDVERSRLRFVREQYAGVLQRLSAARTELETIQAAFKYRYSVISPPLYPKGPKRPYTLLRIVGGLLGGVALALFACTAADLRSGLIVEEWQIPKQLRMTVLARLPP